MRQDYTTIAFATPGKEHAFRALVADEHELGGFVYGTWWPKFFHGLHWRTRRNLFGGLPNDRVLWITDWMVIPNLSKQPQREYTHPALVPYLFEIAEANKPYGTLAYHWHSHPLGSENSLSLGDYRFMVAHCEQWRGHYQAMIASSEPFRLLQYDIRINPKNPRETSVVQGDFLSWRSRAMQPFRALLK
jgi:hypothetical protein